MPGVQQRTMSMTSTTIPEQQRRGGPGTRPRSERPERILLVDGDCLIRNDVLASELGSSERALNRGDADGAPHIYIAGVKYRPQRAYHEYLAGKVKRRGKPPKRRGASQ
jgi:hypothetical protein